jgi:hypothetical protein
MELSGKFVKGTGTYEVKELTTQDAVLKSLDKGVPYFECTSSGIAGILNDQDYGEWEFSIFKPAAGEMRVLINGDVSGYNGGSGYLIYVTAAGLLYFYRSGGPSAQLWYTASGYVEDGWYRLKLTRTVDGEFTLYIKGGTHGADDWVLVVADTGTNPHTDNTHKTINYLVLDLDTDHRIADIKTRKAVQQ